MLDLRRHALGLDAEHVRAVGGHDAGERPRRLEATLPVAHHGAGGIADRRGGREHERVVAGGRHRRVEARGPPGTQRRRVRAHGAPSSQRGDPSVTRSARVARKPATTGVRTSTVPGRSGSASPPSRSMNGGSTPTPSPRARSPSRPAPAAGAARAGSAPLAPPPPRLPLAHSAPDPSRPPAP